MFTHNHQPFGYDANDNLRSNLVDREWKQEVFDELYSNFKSVYKNKFRAKELMSLTTEAAILDAILLQKRYENILVVSSHKDDSHNVTNPNFTPYKNMGHHFLPIINKLNLTENNMYVAQVDNVNNMFTKLYETYGIETIRMTEDYNLNAKKIRLSTDVKFDAVVLLGIEGLKKGKFQSKDIRETFAPYCVNSAFEDFDLIDLYVGDDRTLQPTPDIQETFINSVVSHLRNLGPHNEVYDLIVDRLIELYKVY